MLNPTCANSRRHPGASSQSSLICGTYVVAVEVVDSGLAEHAVVLKLRLAERRGVSGNAEEEVSSDLLQRAVLTPT